MFWVAFPHPERDCCALACGSDFDGVDRILPSTVHPRCTVLSIHPFLPLPVGIGRYQTRISAMGQLELVSVSCLASEPRVYVWF